jgi:hypothetical protein
VSAFFIFNMSYEGENHGLFGATKASVQYYLAVSAFVDFWLFPGPV